MRAASGKKVFLVDADDQRSSYDWYQADPIGKENLDALNVLKMRGSKMFSLLYWQSKGVWKCSI